MIVKVALQGNIESKNSQYKYLHLKCKNLIPFVFTSKTVNVDCMLNFPFYLSSSWKPRQPKTYSELPVRPSGASAHITQEMLPSKALAARDPNKSSKDNLFVFAAAFVCQDCKEKRWKSGSYWFTVVDKSWISKLWPSQRVFLRKGWTNPCTS